jgi:hypothetical protein
MARNPRSCRTTAQSAPTAHSPPRPRPRPRWKSVVPTDSRQTIAPSARSPCSDGGDLHASSGPRITDVLIALNSRGGREFPLISAVDSST